MEEFSALTKGQYPVFNKYPKFIVDYQVRPLATVVDTVVFLLFICFRLHVDGLCNPISMAGENLAYFRYNSPNVTSVFQWTWNFAGNRIFRRLFLPEC